MPRVPIKWRKRPPILGFSDDPGRGADNYFDALEHREQYDEREETEWDEADRWDGER